jgi:thioredoxin-like negative regulator of GroEL
VQTQLSNEEFQKLIDSHQPVLIDFFVSCVQTQPTIEKLAKEYPGKAQVITINYDQNKALTQRLTIDEIPVFLLYKKGRVLRPIFKIQKTSENDFLRFFEFIGHLLCLSQQLSKLIKQVA